MGGKDASRGARGAVSSGPLGGLVAPAGGHPTGGASSFARGSRARGVIAGVALLAALCVVGFLADRALLGHMRRSVASQLTTVLGAEAAALRMWGDHHRALAETYARDVRARELVRAATELSRAELDAGGAPLVARLADALEADMSRHGYVSVSIARHDGEVLTWSRTLGTYLRSTVIFSKMPPVQAALEGHPSVSAPVHPSEVVREASPALAALAPRIFAAAPVWDREGGVAGVLAFGLDPEADFSRILGIARLGKTGETYAFDARGRMVSASRFEAELAALGLLPREPEATSVLTLELRDPGGNLARGYVPTRPIAERPLTRMARAATAQRSGLDLEGYRDYRGVPVVGAWTWMPSLQLGLATELDRAEAFASHIVLRRAFWVLFVLLGVSALALVVHGVVIRVLRRSVADARALGQYRIGEQIGKGGMGRVFRAQHALLARPTAIKILDGSEATPARVRRFEREVQATAALTHPNTIAVYDYGHTPEGTFYYVMELLEGRSLEELVRAEGPLPPARVVHLLRQIAGSLAEAHAAGLVHRDIKPANVMVTDRGGVLDYVKVLDFGLVREVHRPDEANVTSASGVTGTPAYMSPEQVIDPERVGPESDLYQLGAVAYFLLTGSEPFTGKSTVHLLHQHLDALPVAPSERLGRPLPRDLEALVLRCLAKEPAARPASAAEVIERLDALDVPPWTHADAAACWSRMRAAQSHDRAPLGAPFDEPALGAAPRGAG